MAMEICSPGDEDIAATKPPSPSDIAVAGPYPLMAPSVIPLTKSRIEKVKRMITGMLAIA